MYEERGCNRTLCWWRLIRLIPSTSTTAIPSTVITGGWTGGWSGCRGSGFGTGFLIVILLRSTLSTRWRGRGVVVIGIMRIRLRFGRRGCCWSRFGFTSSEKSDGEGTDIMDIDLFLFFGDLVTIWRVICGQTMVTQHCGLEIGVDFCFEILLFSLQNMSLFLGLIEWGRKFQLFNQNLPFFILFPRIIIKWDFRWLLISCRCHCWSLVTECSSLDIVRMIGNRLRVKEWRRDGPNAKCSSKIHKN